MSMVKKSVINTRERFEKEVAKSPLKKDGSNTAEFNKWLSDPEKCTPIVQSVFKTWKENYLPKVEAGELKPIESVEKAKGDTRLMGLCYLKGNAGRAERLKKIHEERKDYEAKFGVKF